MKSMLATLFLSGSLWFNGGLFAQEFSPSNGEQPKLVVKLVVDQMRWDYLHRFSHHFGEGGFKRLMKDGYNFDNAFLNYAPTFTAVGHASISTGTYPAIHGIVGNEWINRPSGGYTYCTDDPAVRPLGGSRMHGRMSPVNLLATTVGDELKLSNNFKSRVYGVSLKDRGGILLAGRSADCAYWLDDSTGNFMTSTWYTGELPAWVNSFNRQRKIDDLMREGWKPALPVSSYNMYRPDENEFEIPISENNNTSFPHELKSFLGKSYTPFRYVPMGNSLTLDFASSLVREEKLGRGRFSDMLCISLSSTDYIGHRFGPMSMEIEDTYIRLDRDVASFLHFLDSAVGKEKYLLVLTADHSAPQVPDFAKSKKLSAGNLNNFGLVDEINSHLELKFARKGLVTHYFNNQFFLNDPYIDSFRLDREQIEQSVIRFLEQREEVVMAFLYSKLNEVVLPADLKERVARGYHPKRCGNIYVILKPQFVDYLGKGTEHGTFYNYDTHIPLIFFGSSIASGRSFRRVGVTDIAPTLSAILKIQMPNASMGVVLEEMITRGR